MNLDTLVTATEAAAERGLPVTRHTIGMWRHAGKVEVKGWRGRSPLYRWGDLVDVERKTRLATRHCHRSRPQPRRRSIAA